MDEPANELRCNIALGRAIMSSCDWGWFRFLTPLIEANGVTVLNGARSGQTVVNLTPGVRWAFTQSNHLGAGCSFPVTGREAFESRFIFSFIHHF